MLGAGEVNSTLLNILGLLEARAGHPEVYVAVVYPGHLVEDTLQIILLQCVGSGLLQDKILRKLQT